MAPSKMTAPKAAAIDFEKLTAAMSTLTTADSADARVSGAGAVAALAYAASASAISKQLKDQIVEASKNKKKPEVRAAAGAAIKALVDKATPAEEPHVMELLDTAITLCGDNKSADVREAGRAAVDSFIKVVSKFSVAKSLPAVINGWKSQFWQSKIAALDMINAYTETGPKQVAACLPEIIPELQSVMVDMKTEVVTAATATMTKVCDVVGNKDIDPFIPTLIECITNINEVPECVHKLAATTFVQQVEAPTLAIMGPLLQRGLAPQQKTAIKRKSAVIIDNMCKLVEDPMDAAPFLPKLLPGLKRAVEEVSDPECRDVSTRALKTLLQAAGETSAPGEDGGSTKLVTTDTVTTMMTAELAAYSGCAAADVDAYFAEPSAGIYLTYICSLGCNAILSKNFEEDDWASVVVGPYLANIMSKKDAESFSKDLVIKAKALYEANKKVYVEDDEEGEDLCDCEFSLAYGAMILLNNARLRMKKGKRYGLCGPNGCGKSTLMKAINNGQVEGFPPPEELRTVYVEHDIQSDATEENIVDFILSNPIVQAAGATKEDTRSQLASLGFTEVMMDGPITALSGGWKMKLALARAILMKADILLLDEPTNHLDVTNVAWLQNYLCSLTTVSSMIVSHDSGFLDEVCSHIIHYETRKLKTYRGNLTEFVRQYPPAKKYYELSDDELKFIFPEPGFLEGVKNKDKAIVKANNCTYGYPGTGRMIIERPATIQISLSSRVGCLGPNGAGKSTFIKLLTGEAEPDTGTVWKHPNMRYAYVAQHAFHHVEQHLEKTPNEYIRWRFQTGEDKENLTKVTAQYTPEEEAKMKEKIEVEQEDGTRLKLVVEKILSRRQKKNKYEYEVQWVGLSMDQTTWMEKDKLIKHGFEKYLIRVDEREAARAGLYARPLTLKNVEKHLIDFGLDAEFGTHNRVKGLSGGQKVKVVLAAAMWQQPHVVILDEPTNYLDRDALGALACAIKDFGGGVVMITHNNEFSNAICKETWKVGGGVVEISGNLWGQGSSGKGERLEFKPQEDTIDALGNTVKVKGPKKKLSRKDIKAKAKARKAKLDNGQDLSTDSDWELDEYIGGTDEDKAKEEAKKLKDAEKEAAKAAKAAEKDAKKGKK